MATQLRKNLLMLVAALLLVALGFMLGTGTLLNVAQDEFIPIAEINRDDAPTLSALEATYATIYENVSPSVVAISVVAERVNGFGEQGIVTGSGSGFVIDKNGHIVTNYHVVEGASEIEINFVDGTIVRGEIVGLDPDSDLAVLSVDVPAEGLTPVEFGSVDDLTVGQQVLAIGSPFGQRWTLTAGIVSALNRRIDSLTNFSIGAAIQTDTPINPGNSGGPLLNTNGQVIGVNSQILSQSRSNAGVGFAVPSDLVVRVVNELINDGRVDYAYVGIGIDARLGDGGGNVDLDLIESLELPNGVRGVVVGSVEPGGPADQAGLRGPAGTADGLMVDIITAIDGEPLTGFDELVAYLARNTRPGDRVELTVYRDGEFLNLPMVLGSRPN